MKRKLTYARKQKNSLYTVAIWTAVEGSDAWQAEQRSNLSTAEAQAWIDAQSAAPLQAHLAA